MVMDSNSSKQQETSDHKPPTWHALKRHISGLLLTIIVDIILPLAIFFTLQIFIKPVYAIICAGVPPLIMIIFKAIRLRRFDVLGFIVLVGFIISAILGIITQDPILLLLGQACITGTICLIFTVTLIPFYRCHQQCQLRPLAYYLYQDLAPTSRAQLGLPEHLFENKSLLSDKHEITQVYQWLYTNCLAFRRSCYIITIIWSIGLLFGFLGQLILILIHLSINIIVIYGHVILTSITIFCIILCVIQVKNERKQTIIFIEQWKKEQLSLV